MNERRKKAIIFFIFLTSILILIFLLKIILSGGSDSSSTNEWLMRGRTLNHTSWDGISYQVIPGLNNATFVSGIGAANIGGFPIIVKGYVYIEKGDNSLYQLNASNISQQIAKFSLIFAVGSTGSISVANGYLYTGSNDHNVYQLNASNISQQIASFTTGGITPSLPAVANGYVYVSSEDGKIYQLNASNISQQIANFTTGSQILSSPAVANGYVYVGSQDTIVYQLNASNISQQIANFTTGGLIVESSPAVSNSYVYIGTWNGNVYQLNASNISQQAAIYATGALIYSSPAMANGYVYIGSDSHNLYQLNASNISQQAAIYFADSNIRTSPAVANGYVYVGSTLSFYQLNASNISQQIANFTNGTGYSSPSVANGYVYFGSNDRTTVQLNANNISFINNDFIVPNITILSPTSGSYSNVTQLNYSVSDNVGVSSCWYSINGGITNSSPDATCSNVTINAVTGSNTWTIYVNDTSRNVNSSTTTFTISLPNSGNNGGNGNGGSGGSGGTVVPNYLEETRFFSAVSNIPVTINISDVDLTKLTIVTNKNVSNATLSIYNLNNIPNQINENGTIYRSFEIRTTGINDSNIVNVSINFDINNSWILSNNFDPLNVVLYRNNGENWKALPTSSVSHDSLNYHFTAISPGFSTYVVFVKTSLCTLGDKRCSGNQFQICSNQGWILSQNCEFGCLAGRCMRSQGEQNVQNIADTIKNFISNLFVSLKSDTGSIVYYSLLVMIILGTITILFFVLKTWKRNLNRSFVSKYNAKR